MPSRIMSAFTTSPPPSASPSESIYNETTLALESPIGDKKTRRASLTKGNNRFVQFFTQSPRSRPLDSPPSTPSSQLSGMSQPAVSYTTAVSDKTKPEDRSQTDLRRLAKQHAEFGPLGSQEHRYTSRFEGGEFPEPVIDEPPLYYVLTTYISYLILIIFGHVRDFFGKRFRPEAYKQLKAQDGYAPLYSDFDNFYIRRLKMRINDCFSRPITGVPGRYVKLLDRFSNDGNYHFQMKGTTTDTLNMSSYNYLGFAQSEGPCADAVQLAIEKYGISFASPAAVAGTSDLLVEVEDLIADFVGKESAMVFSMGFVTNAASFSALVGKGCLILSDELNHSSIRFGARLSGAMIKMFKHNDMNDLERVLRDSISQGQPRTHRPWRKILVAVEGLYSMEGTMCNLPRLVELRDKYKYYLFVDEAHSIGAVGPTGKGVCEYFGINTADVDILMGTFTKSFGANGGYIAGDRAAIDKLRATNAATLYGEAPTPSVLVQVAVALKIIRGDLVPGQGEERLQRLAFNSRYLRLGLKRLGFIVLGQDDSPIVPLLLYNPAKMPAFSHEMLRRKISVVVVGYPATPLLSSRARFCVSAAHTKDDLDRMLAACDQIGDVLQLKFSSGIAGGAEPLIDGLSNEEEQQFRKQGIKQAKRDVKPPRWKLDEIVRRGVQDVKMPLT